MRAASTACTVSGIGSVVSGSPSTQAPSDSTRAPLSTSSPTSSSRKNGLPPARSTTDRRRSSGSAAGASRRACARRRRSEAGRARAPSRCASRRPTPPAPRASRGERSRARRAGRARPRRCVRADRADRARPSGCPRPGAPSDGPSGDLLDERAPRRHGDARARRAGGARARRPARARARGSLVPRGPLDAPRRMRPRAARSCSRTISPSGQYVIPSPYARQRPVRPSGAGSSLARTCQKLPHEPRLPDARLADDRHEVRLGLRRSAP